MMSHIRLESRSGPTYVGPDLGDSLFASSRILFKIFYFFSNEEHQLFCYNEFLAHLAHSAKVSFWDRAVSVVRRRPSSSVVRRASSVVRRASCVNNLLKHLLLRFDWA